MILLSPPKLLMILVIALIVLGPDKLPSAARRIGALWHEFTRWRAHLEREVRATFPDLPSTTEIARTVRSPLSLLDRLADEHGTTHAGGPSGPLTDGPSSSAGTVPGPAPSARGPSAVSSGAQRVPGVDFVAEPDISSMN